MRGLEDTMKLEIRDARRDPKEWDDFVLSTEEGSPFHQWGWLSAMEEAYGLTYQHWQVFKGDEPVAALPLFLDRRKGLRVTSVVYSGYLGPVVRSRSNYARSQTLLHNATETLLVKIAQLRPRSVHINLTPWVGDIRVFIWSGYEVEVHYTHLLSLEPSLASEEKALTKGARANLRMAREYPGLRVVRDEISEADMDQLWGLLRSTYQRAGLKLPDLRPFLRALRSQMPEDNLWTIRAEINDETVAGAIFIRFGGKICYWIAMSNALGRKSGAPTAILWRALKDGRGHGDTVLDLMGGQVRNLAVFKAGFQAPCRPYYLVNCWNSRLATLSARLEQIVRARLA